MKVAFACDHGGFPLKAVILDAIRGAGHEAIDLGTNSSERVDYPDYALKLGDLIQSGEADRGVLVCGSGVGACVAVNKVHGVRAGICHDTYSAHQGVEHDDMNVLCLGARIIGPALAPELVRAFLGAQFLNRDAYARRLEKVKAIEAKGGK